MLSKKGKRIIKKVNIKNILPLIKYCILTTIVFFFWIYGSIAFFNENYICNIHIKFPHEEIKINNTNIRDMEGMLGLKRTNYGLYGDYRAISQYIINRKCEIRLGG
jgi:hypothetical protein